MLTIPFSQLGFFLQRQVQKKNYMKLNRRQTISDPDTVRKPSIDDILQNTVQFANSYGLQPFKIIVREGDINNQPASKQNSYLIVFAIRPEFTRKYISAFIRNLTILKHIPESSLDSYKERIESNLNVDKGSGKKWAEKQAFIALDILLESAKQKGAEATMVENLNTDQYDQVLGLSEKGWQTLTALMISLHTPKTNPRKTPGKTINSTF
jgi:hypothetical protein